MAIRTVVLNLIGAANKCWHNDVTFGDYPLSSRAFTTFQNLHSFTKEFKYDDFDDLTKQTRKKFKLPPDRSIYLPPLNDDVLFVPLLTFELDSATPAKANFRIDLFNYDESVGRFYHVGFRFETPTQASDKHRYYHVQPNEEPSINSIPTIIPSSYKNGTVPCFPLRADSPVSLILCLIASLYGAEGFHKVMSGVEISKSFKRDMTTSLAHGKDWEDKEWVSRPT